MGCSGRPIYNSFISIEDGRWLGSKEVFFSFPVSDTISPINVTLEVRVLPTFDIAELPLGVVVESPGREYKTQTVRLSTNGRLLQKGYNFYNYHFVLDSARVFPKKGTYTYSIRHLLKDSIAIGVINVGLYVGYTAVSIPM